MSELISNVAATAKKHRLSASQSLSLSFGLMRDGGRKPRSNSSRVSLMDLGNSKRMAVMITPNAGASFTEQLRELFAALDDALTKAPGGMSVTAQTVFLRDPARQAEWEKASAEFYGSDCPVTYVVHQPPCSGAEMALEAWAICGETVQLRRHTRNAVTLDYDGVRWVYCGGIQPTGGRGTYRRTLNALEHMRDTLQAAGSDMEHVVRTWFYLGDITEPEGRTQRYKELNRARSDFYQDIRFSGSLLPPNTEGPVFPASTGIGIRGRDILLGCVALQTARKDVFLLPLENPQQTPAYAYHPKYSPKSPKFSRAVALFLGHYTTTWISGTASIVDSESKHPEDVVRQTEQTIDNIERLIAKENFALHGLPGAGASLKDLAKLRVYIKRPEHYAACRSICERRFGSAPVIYALADVCRPELLVEIEGVAFSPYSGLKPRV